MTRERQDESIRYAQVIAEIVQDLQVNEAAQVYQLAFHLWSQSDAGPLPVVEEDDEGDSWLDDSEEEMAAEDILWAATLARYSDKFDALAAAAQLEIANGTTQPMFDQDGKMIVDELSHNA